MCDTQVLITPHGVWLAKNSDREPAEPQAVVRVPGGAVRERTQQLSYLRVEAPRHRHAVLLSKPVWCWGAEMGVNECGVAIGNEAVFTRRRSCAPALLGMDLVRLGLERAGSADEALSVMTALLERYGQGGPAGYHDRGFCYDNSFLIADARGAWVLETAGRDWVARPVRSADAISNLLTIGEDYTRCSDGVARMARAAGRERIDFARRFDTVLLPRLAGARRRLALSRRCLAPLAADAGQASFARFAAHLRAHADQREEPLAGSPGDVCLHANGFIRRAQTTGAMIVRLTADRVAVAFTGTSAPCLSAFRPAAFAGGWAVLSPDPSRAPLWQQFEPVHQRALFDRDFRLALRAERDALEPALWRALADGDTQGMQDADEALFRWTQRWVEAARASPPRANRFWRRVRALQATG